MSFKIHTIADIQYIKKNCYQFSPEVLANKTFLSLYAVNKIIEKLNRIEAKEEQSIATFKRVEKQKIERKAAAAKPAMKLVVKKVDPLEEKKKHFIIIPPEKVEEFTRPAAVYTNTNWDEYSEKL